VIVKVKMVPVSRQRIDALLEGLVRLAGVDLANNPQIPPLYASGVRYRREKPDKWLMPSDVLRQGHGDCEDLSAWLCAQTRRSGGACSAVAYRSGRRMWHVVVRHGDGRIEDPSKILGMKGAF